MAVLHWSALSLAIVILAMAVCRSAIYARHAEVLAWGFTFDLTLTIPLLYYAFIVRSGYARTVTIAPVFVICVAVAMRVIPPDQQQFVHQLRYLTAPLDVVTMWLVARRLARGHGTGNSIIDRVMSSELAILRYGLFSWRKAEPVGFTVHKRNDWATVVVCFIVVIVAESIGVHLLVHHWSMRAARFVTAADVYGILWLLGDYHALRLRPMTIEGGTLHVRYGLRWSADVALTNIAAITEFAGHRSPGTLTIAMLDDPRLLIELREPVMAHGLLGITKSIDAIAILPDEPERFEGALRLARQIAMAKRLSSRDGSGP